MTDARRLDALAVIDRVGRIGLVVGGIFLVLTVVGALVDRSRFFESYLIGYLWVAAVPIGSLALLTLYHLTGGGWGLVIRRILEAAIRTLPLVALLFVPILLGMEELYPWADPAHVQGDELLEHKAPYLNRTAFAVRAAAVFALWTLMGLVLDRLSAAQSRTLNPRVANRLKAFSAPFLILWCICGTVAGIDWLMSLDPHWYSSLYGVYFFESMALGALAFAILMVVALSKTEPLSRVMRKGFFHDYGNLLLAFTMLWAYFAFSQFLIIWSGNLPEEIPWYLTRATGGYKLVTQVLVLFHFVLPFLLLLTHAVKGHPGRLMAVAALILVMRGVDYYWQAAPPLHHDGIHWLDLSAPLCLAGLWLAAFCWQLKRRSLLPEGDPGLEEALGDD